MCPQNFQRRGEQLTLTTPATGGAQNPGKPSANEGGQWGGQGGEAPMAGGRGGVPFTPTEVSLFEKGRPAPTLIKAGVEGAQPPPRGLGDVPPKFSKKGRAANSYHPATGGTQNAGKPSANEGGKRGSMGAKPPWRGLWGVSPFTPTEVSLFEKGRPAPTLIKAGGGGGAAPSQGVWGMCPQNFQRRGEQLTLTTPATGGAQNPGKPSANEGGKRGFSP